MGKRELGERKLMLPQAKEVLEAMGEENFGKSRESGRKLPMETAITRAIETLDGLVLEFC